MDGNYVCTTKVIEWIESLTTKALKDFRRENGKIYYDMKLSNNKTIRLNVRIINQQEYHETFYCLFQLTLIKQIPAFTLKISAGDIHLDVDLVICFQFTDKHWPNGYKKNPVPSKVIIIMCCIKTRKVCCCHVSSSLKLLKKPLLNTEHMSGLDKSLIVEVVTVIFNNYDYEQKLYFVYNNTYNFTLNIVSFRLNKDESIHRNRSYFP